MIFSKKRISELTCTIILMLFSFSEFCFSQTKTTLSEPYPEFRGGADKSYFYEDNYAYAVKFNYDELRLQKFDPKVPKLDRDIKLPMKFPRGVKILTVLKLKDYCYAFYFIRNNKTKEEELHAFEVDYKNSKINEVARKIASFKGVAYDENDTPKFSFVPSADANRLLVYCKRFDAKDDSKIQSTYQLFTFEGNLKPIWNNEFVIPYVNENINIKCFFITNGGVPNLLISKKENNTGKLFRFNTKTNGVETIAVIDKIDWEGSFKLHENKNGELLIAGYIVKEEKYLIVINIDKPKTDIYNIPTNVLNHYKNKTLVYDPIEILEIHNQDDGGLIVLANYRPETLNTSIYGFAGIIGKTRYYYDYVIAKINSKASLEWMSLLPSRFDMHYHAFRPIYNYEFADGKHYLVYVTSQENKLLALNETPISFSYLPEQALCTYEIDDKDGMTKRYKLMNAKLNIGLPIWYVPSCDVIYVGNRTFVTDYYKKNDQDIFIKMEF